MDDFVPTSYPQIGKILGNQNGMFCNSLGVRRKLINPRTCPQLVKAYDSYCYVEGSNLGDKSSGFDHATDADSYSTIGAFPIVIHTVSMSQVSI